MPADRWQPELSTPRLVGRCALCQCHDRNRRGAMRDRRWWLDPGSGTNDETPIAVGEIVKTYTEEQSPRGFAPRSEKHFSCVMRCEYTVYVQVSSHTECLPWVSQLWGPQQTHR